MDKKKWFYVAIACVAVSVLSLFTSIITYTAPSGVATPYSLLDLLQGTEFRDNVLSQYRGPVLWSMGGSTVSVLAFIAVAALVCAIVGLVTLRAQRPNKWNFVLTIVGLIGTSFPSFLVILAVVLSGDYFNGSISCGVSPVITPVAMVICIYVVIRRRNKVLEQLRMEMEAKGMIWQAGDL